MKRYNDAIDHLEVILIKAQNKSQDGRMWNDTGHAVRFLCSSYRGCTQCHLLECHSSSMICGIVVMKSINVFRNIPKM